MAVTRTPVVDNPASVKVEVSKGQFLHFTVVAGGPAPIFSFASGVKGVLHQAADFPAGTSNFQWDHLKNPSDVEQLDQLELRLSFFTNAKYTYTVELQDSSGVVNTVLQINYTGTPMDIAPESFLVVII